MVPMSAPRIPTNNPSVSPTADPTVLRTVVPSAWPLSTSTTKPIHMATSMPTSVLSYSPSSPSPSMTSAREIPTKMPTYSATGLPTNANTGPATTRPTTGSDTNKPFSRQPSFLPTHRHSALPSRSSSTFRPTLESQTNAPTGAASLNRFPTLHPSQELLSPVPTRSLAGDARALCSLMESTNFASIVANRGLQGWRCHSGESLLQICTTWSGVTCASGKVHSVDLSGLGIAGALVDEFGSMDELVMMNMSGNDLEGPLPTLFSSLRKLELLDLGGNKLGRDIVSSTASTGGSAVTHLREGARRHLATALGDAQVLSLLPALSLLDIGSNGYTGPLPATLCNLQLDTLILSKPDAAGTPNSFSCIPQCLTAIDTLVGGDNLPICQSETVVPTSAPSAKVFVSRKSTTAAMKTSSLYMYVLPAIVLMFCICCCVGYYCLCVTKNEKDKEIDEEACKCIDSAINQDPLIKELASEDVEKESKGSVDSTDRETDKEKDSSGRDMESNSDGIQEHGRIASPSGHSMTHGTWSNRVAGDYSDVPTQGVNLYNIDAEIADLATFIEDSCENDGDACLSLSSQDHSIDEAVTREVARPSLDRGISRSFQILTPKKVGGASSAVSRSAPSTLHRSVSGKVRLSNDEGNDLSSLASREHMTLNLKRGSSMAGSICSNGNSVDLNFTRRTKFGQDKSKSPALNIVSLSRAKGSKPRVLSSHEIDADNASSSSDDEHMMFDSARFSLSEDEISGVELLLNAVVTRVDSEPGGDGPNVLDRECLGDNASLQALSMKFGQGKSKSPVLNIVSLSRAKGSKPRVLSSHEIDADNASSSSDDEHMMFDSARFSLSEDEISGVELLLNAVVTRVDSEPGGDGPNVLDRESFSDNDSVIT